MDFYYKKSFRPNPTAMKISSFHKQQGHLINFVTEEYHINLTYDLYYIIREKSATPKPPGIFIDDKRVRLIGDNFRFFDNYYNLDPVISAVRPDYLLYPENPRDAYYNAHIAQFYHKGIRINKKQPFENTKEHHKKTLVVDKEFWDASEKDIVSCLQELKNYRNVAFLYPINLKKIIENDMITSLFKELHFSQGTIFKFRNNFGQELHHAQVLFLFITELKEKNSHVRFSNLPFKSVTTDHWESSKNAIKDLKRCLKIVNEAKKFKVHIRLVSPRNRFDSPYWYYFEILEFWTLYRERLSYIELMLHSAIKRTGLPWYGILNNSIKWITPNTYFLLAVMTKHPEWIKDYGLRQWGDEMLGSEWIDWNVVNLYKGDLEKNLENSEEEEWQK